MTVLQATHQPVVMIDNLAEDLEETRPVRIQTDSFHSKSDDRLGTTFIRHYFRKNSESLNQEESKGHTHTHTHTHTHIHTHTHTHTHKHTQTQTHIHTHKETQSNKHIYTRSQLLLNLVCRWYI